MNFNMPNILPNFGSTSTSFYQKNGQIKGILPASFHLLPYYARHNELNILRELHSKLSDPKKKLHQKMLMDAIMREQLAIRGYIQNNQFIIKKKNNKNDEILSKIQKSQSNLGKRNQKQKSTTTDQTNNNNSFTVIDSTTNLFNNGSDIKSIIANSIKEKKVTRKRKCENEAVSGLDIIQNLNSIKNQKIGEVSNNIVNCNTSTNFTPTCNASSYFTIKYPQLDLTQGQNALPNQQIQSNISVIPSPFNFTQIHQLNTTSSSSDINSITSSSPINTEELTKRREDFIKEATSLYNNKYRILSNSVYDFYVNRLKITQNLDPRILLKKDLEIKSKFQLAVFNEGGKTIERLVENGKLHRKLISIEKVFDVIHEYHNRFGHGKKLAISNALKQEYANITLNCVLLYMTNCKECFMASKNSKTLNKDTTMEGSSSDFQNEMKPIIEDNDVIELEEKIVTNNYFDYNKHFTISQNDIRCKHCEFIYLLTNLNKNQEKILKSHLINYHKQFYNEIISKGNINEEDDKVEEVEEEENDDFN